MFRITQMEVGKDLQGNPVNSLFLQMFVDCRWITLASLGDTITTKHPLILSLTESYRKREEHELKMEPICSMVWNPKSKQFDYISAIPEDPSETVN